MSEYGETMRKNCNIINHMRGGIDMDATIRIKFFMDYICEWCFLGYEILKKLNGKYEFNLEMYPLEIHPDTPIDGMPMSRHISDKKKWTAQLNQLGNPYGIHLADKDIFSNTRNALIVGQYAKTIGRQKEFTDVLWAMYMEEGHNISSQEMVKHVALEAGLSLAQVQEAFTDPIYQAALLRNQQYQQAFGTDQVPAFVINEKYIMIGAQSLDTWEELFQKIKSEMGNLM